MIWNKFIRRRAESFHYSQENNFAQYAFLKSPRKKLQQLGFKFLSNWISISFASLNFNFYAFSVGMRARNELDRYKRNKFISEVVDNWARAHKALKSSAPLSHFFTLDCVNWWKNVETNWFKLSSLQKSIFASLPCVPLCGLVVIVVEKYFDDDK